MTSNPSIPAAQHPAEDAPGAETVSPPLFTSGVSGEHAELQRQGAKAAARGEQAVSNPMFESANQPDATGESSKAWSERRDAWSRGHLSQQSVAHQHSAPIPAGSEPSQDQALFGVTRVLTFRGPNSLTAASGFFFERDHRLFLITSRHVLFDEATDHAPDRIEIEMHTDARDLTRVATVSILLYRNGKAEWVQAHDSEGPVDIAALALDAASMPAGHLVRAFTPADLGVGFSGVEVGDHLVIPGFPLGFFDTVHHLPVARQAAVASCYGVRFQGAGYFLTDARMHRGCSGSPVLGRVTGAAREQDHRWRLLGVHSSRMDMASRDSALDESLGLNCAWYADVLMVLTGRPL